MNRRQFVKALLGTAAAAAILPKLDLLPEAVPEAVAAPVGWAATGATFVKGDIFSISGVYLMHPITGKTLPHLAKFVVVSDVMDTNEPQIVPQMRINGPYRNVSNFPADDARIVNALTGGPPLPIAMEWSEIT